MLLIELNKILKIEFSFNLEMNKDLSVFMHHLNAGIVNFVANTFR